MSRRVALCSALLLSATVASVTTPVHAVGGDRPESEGVVATGALPAPPAPDTPSDEVVVEFRDGVDDTTRERVLADRGLELVEPVGDSDFVVARPVDGGRRSAASAATAAISAAVAAPEVVGAEPIVPMHAYAEPNDFYYPAQWHLPMIQASKAWDVSTGTGVVVAVIDSGVAYRSGVGAWKAPDLAGTRFTKPWDFVDNDPYPDDLYGHGTHVTGSVAQTTGNGLGVAGLAHGATIMPLRALDAKGAGTDAHIAAAIRYAADNGAQIANLSLGGAEPSNALRDAVTYAHGKGLIMVAASGNEATDVGYPAAYPEVIAVGAVNTARQKAGYSNFGPELDLVAPGGDGNGGVLQQAFRPGSPDTFSYLFMSGTSMAAPQVAAAAALLMAEGVKGPAVRAALEGSALDLGSAGRDDLFGHGLLQARSALDRAGKKPKPPFVAGVSARPIDAACPIAAVRRGRFPDVAQSDLHGRAIDCLAWLGISTGTGTVPNTYNPGGNVSRAQMATFIGRTIHKLDASLLPVSPPDAFADDNAYGDHQLWINRLAAVGVVRGNATGRYNPDGAVTREVLATFLVRAHDLVAATDLVAPRAYFTDNTSPDHGKNVDAAASAGLTSGTSPGVYSPGTALRRNQMASFLARLVDLLETTAR